MRLIGTTLHAIEMRALSLAIVGIPYPNAKGPTRRFEVELCKPGEPVELRPEPKNPADENAIAIFSCRGVQLGYVASVRAVLIMGFIRAGAEPRAVFQGVSGAGAWVRATFDGSEPIVDLNEKPRSATSVDDVDGFWPDPVYED
jgi:hypothetical protein